MRLHYFPANAFALPSGLVVVSDSLATMLNDDELAAVFAHEIGHVVHRHGMRSALGSSGLLLLVTLLGGDISGIVASGGAVLLSLKYSRDYEREADCVAYDYLRRRNMPASLVEDALGKMDLAYVDDKPKRDSPDPESFWNHVFIALSTHPGAEARKELGRHLRRIAGARWLSVPVNGRKFVIMLSAF